MVNYKEIEGDILMAVSQVSEKEVDDLLKIHDLEAVGNASWKYSSNNLDLNSELNGPQ